MTKLLNVTAAIAASLFLAVLANPAEAMNNNCSYDNNSRVTCMGGAAAPVMRGRYSRHRSYADANGNGAIVAHPAGCPGRAFCGCGTCVKVGFSLAECKRMGLFLARNWFHRFPRTAPSAGMVAARSGHVMYIMAYQGNGLATVYDPNSGGHRTRVHTRSLSGYTIVNPHGRSTAMLSTRAFP